MLSNLLGNSGKDLGQLFQSSLKLFGDIGVRAPSLRRFRLSLLNHSIVAFSILSLFYNYHSTLGSLLLFLEIFVLVPYSFFYKTRMKAYQAWMVYASITKRRSTFEDAIEATQNQKWTLRLFSLIELLFATRSRSQGSKENPGLLGIFMSALETVFDVAEDYLLPAIVIEQKSIRETVGKLEQLKVNIPASLSGAFGIDLFGGAISSFTTIIHSAILLVGAGIGFLLVPMIPQELVTAVPSGITEALSFIPHQIFLLPLILALIVNSLFHQTIKIFISSLKNVYFSVFYVSINHPLEIREELRDNLTNYLNVKDQSYVQTFKTKLPSGPTTVQKTDAETLQVIEGTFKENIAKGHSIETISNFLRKKGYPEKQIQSVIVKYKRSA